MENCSCTSSSSNFAFSKSLPEPSWKIEWWSPIRYVHVLTPGTYECYPIWIKDLGDIIKDLEMRSFPGLSRWDLNPVPSVLIRVTEERHPRGRGDGHVKTEVEIGEMQTQAKGHQEPPEDEEVEKDSQRERACADTP